MMIRHSFINGINFFKMLIHPVLPIVGILVENLESKQTEWDDLY